VTFGPYASNGYEEEWRFLARLVQGTEQPLDLDELIHDLTFALAVAGEAADAVRAATKKETAA
jgi:hypothetical protein